MSTSGVSPLTVTVSSSAATVSCNGTVAFCPTSSSISGIFTVPKPGSSAAIEYLPGGTFCRRYSPRSFDTVVRTRPVARSVAVTVTPGSTAFDWSISVPTTVAFCCALATAGHVNARSTVATRIERWRSMIPSRLVGPPALVRGKARPTQD